MSRHRFFGAALRQILCVALAVIVLTPFVVVLVNSVKTKAEAAEMRLSIPAHLEWGNYAVAVERGKLVVSFLNSLLYAAGGTAGTLVVTSLAAWVLSRRRSPLTRFLYFFICLGIVLPSNYVTLIKVMQVTHVINTRVGIILLYMAVNTAFATFIIHGFVASVPREMDESAALDGARPLRLFFSIIFPLLQPVLVTVAVLCFMQMWNEFITPLYVLNRASSWPMTLSVYSFFGQYEQEWNHVFADIVLTVLPVIVVYLVGQKTIVSGMIAGAVKG